MGMIGNEGSSLQLEGDMYHDHLAYFVGGLPPASLQGAFSSQSVPQIGRKKKKANRGQTLLTDVFPQKESVFLLRISIQTTAEGCEEAATCCSVLPPLLQHLAEKSERRRRLDLRQQRRSTDLTADRTSATTNTAHLRRNPSQ
ncbi:unnamed protein product [Pleuronectes platessa]|uniref:Uncharacterized protein n=1 Tax=Pleuronectes platessa TaxID=8262 RepID=A0A9N7U555_PLEPL|nr:unnamed protein product [Pleuronectes platessa]